MPFEKWWPQAVSSSVEECLRSAALSAESVVAKRQMTTMSWRQERSWADMLSRAASRLHPSPLQWTKPTRQERCQREHSAGRDFHNIGPRACENCKRLVEVNLMSTDITALLTSTFAHCVAMTHIWLPPRLTQIGKEAFLSCIALQEVVIPTELQEIGIRAFCGCEQLRVFPLLDLGENDQHIQAEHNAFLLCDNFEQPLWVELLPTEGPDSDAFDEELYTEFP